MRLKKWVKITGTLVIILIVLVNFINSYTNKNITRCIDNGQKASICQELNK